MSRTPHDKFCEAVEAAPRWKLESLLTGIYSALLRLADEPASDDDFLRGMRAGSCAALAGMDFVSDGVTPTPAETGGEE